MNPFIPPLLFLSAFIAGCSVTPDDLRGASGRSYTETIAGEPEQVYRRMVQATRACVSKTALKFDADFFTDTKEGDLLLRFQDDWSNVAIVTAQIRSEGKGLVRFTAHYRVASEIATESNMKMVKNMATWGAGKDAPCFQ